MHDGFIEKTVSVREVRRGEFIFVATVAGYWATATDVSRNRSCLDVMIKSSLSRAVPSVGETHAHTQRWYSSIHSQESHSGFFFFVR